MPETLERLQRLPAALGIGSPSATDCHLTLEQPGEESREIPLLGTCYRIGRDSSAEVVVDHAVVSRRHALLERHGQQWLLRDSASTNGLWWHGRRVQALVLRDGDRVRLGPDTQGEIPSLVFHQIGRAHV